jgi:branched-chain amino acid transport system permease protein
VNSYYIDVASQMLIWGVFAVGLNVLSGYGRLTSLGHAALFGLAAYAAAILLGKGFGQFTAALLALVATLLTTALMAVLALRGSGISFLMITLAAGQIVWGVAYRWISLTNGENGINIPARPQLLGLDITSAPTFFLACALVFAAALLCTWSLVRSPLGAAIRGTRDQPRRMAALGFNTWAIRFFAFMYSGFWVGVAGLLYLYYNQFVSPHAMALATSAEALLMVIVGGAGTLFGPVAGAVIVVAIKNIASAYVERWNFLLGLIFVLIIIFMSQGLVPGTVAAWRRWRGAMRAPPVAAREKLS